MPAAARLIIDLAEREKQARRPAPAADHVPAQALAPPNRPPTARDPGRPATLAGSLTTLLAGNSPLRRAWAHLVQPAAAAAPGSDHATQAQAVLDVLVELSRLSER